MIKSRMIGRAGHVARMVEALRRADHSPKESYRMCIGYAICLIDIYMGMCYNTIIGWAVYYLFASFDSKLPWMTCDNPWNTLDCTPVLSTRNNRSTSPAKEFFELGFQKVCARWVPHMLTPQHKMQRMGLALQHLNRYHDEGHDILARIVTGDESWVHHYQPETKRASMQWKHPEFPVKTRLRRSVLEQYKADGLDRVGPVKWSLALCVLAVFLLVYFALWKGVRSAGKAVWVTALAPYVVLFILLVRGVTLPGAAEGIQYYLTPQWHKLKNSRVWIDAASQIFFSLGPGFGTLLALSSYNKFNNNCYRDAIVTSSINCLTSFLAGFVIFSVLGYMAHMQHKTVQEVGLEGPGLVFIVYPEAIATMAGSVFWSIIFFLMLITLGLDSTFGGLEAMITALCDEYPRLLGRHREIFVAVLLTGIYICALPTTTYGGVYLVNLLNVYGPGISILFVVFVEAAGVCWFYGVDRFSHDVEKMIGHRPGIFWRVCWNYISPVFLLVIFIFSLLGYEEMLQGEYTYPAWTIMVGWALTASSLLCIPLYIVYKLIITPGNIIQVYSMQSRVKGTYPPLSRSLFICT
ncbi:Sodium-dependent serotonin transporter [Cryptotermes secundus]|uniref:Sodium-dependent serotonin transporter n=1 Tax=Cryptotermes secundus TaxID=105785 RepID=A0A2J7Q0F8_9NEOP|nr:Sodium-dependent serotonin transporter [Cryptotermes secundus]